MSDSAFTVTGISFGGGGGGTVNSVTGTLNRITSTGGVNPVIDIAPTYVGQASITTVGTLTTGAIGSGFTTIATSFGGSGVASPTAHGILIAEGASPFTPLILTDNQLLVGQTGADPIGTLTPAGLTSIGVGNLSLSANTLAATGSLTFTTTGNANINLLPNGVGSVLLAADPTLSLGAATKHYVDAIASGLTPEQACLVATTTNLNAVYANGAGGVGATLTNAGAQVALQIDGIALSLADRVLVKNQTAQEENGIYTVTDVGSGASNWELTRATDYDQAAEIKQGSLVIIVEGTANGITSWVQTAVVTIVGTDPIIFSQFTAGAGVTSVHGTPGQIDVTVGQNPIVSIDPAYIGQGSITTVGTLTSGTLGTGFTPVTVPLGGTGLTSTTPFAVVCGGATSTGNLEQVSGLGAVGSVLTSNGPGVLPSWQTSAAGGKVVQIVSTAVLPGSSTSSGSYVDVTGATATITPTSASNNILVMINWQVTVGLGGGNTLGYFQVLRNAVNISGVDKLVCTAATTSVAAIWEGPQVFNFVDSPATTSPVTYKIQQRCTPGGGFTLTSSNVIFILMEVTP